MGWNTNIVDTNILAVHAALVPNGGQGEVVLFGGDEHWSAQQEPDGDFRKTELYDVATHSMVADGIPSPDSDVFCAHHAFAADGRLLIVGGTQKWPESGDIHVHDLDFLGHRRCWVYNHVQRTWREIQKLNPDPSQPDEPHSGGRWYPGVVTLGNGDVIAFYGHPDQQDSRHRNTLPERYRQAANQWTNLPKDIGTVGEPGTGGRRLLFFPRCFVMPNGLIFFATPMPADFVPGTEGSHFSTAFNPLTGEYVSPRASQPSTSAYNDWDRPCVLLPLLPEEDYRMRMVHVGGTSPIRLDLGESSPSWQPAGTRDAAIAGRDRRFANAVLLPTGEVCVVGGVANTDPEDPVLQTEIYNPGINWSTASYSNPESWTTKESGVHARNYHSTALLLTNGKVWVAGGNTNGGSGNPDSDVEVNGVTKKRAIKKIELYEPDYISQANRIEIEAAPRFLTYNTEFEVRIDRLASNVQYACLIRCGTVTHSTNNDQRFVGLSIESRSGNTLNLVSPPHGNVAPPGYYMLWLLDNADAPCEMAKIVRVGHVVCTIVTDRSTFSKEEVEALGGGGQATFTNAVYIQYDGFIHTEITTTPDIEVTWADDGSPVSDADITLVPAGRLQEIEPGFADTTQRITFPFHVRISASSAFSSFTDRRGVRVTARLGSLTCIETLDLTYSPNPYMIDIDPVEANPAWLSTDVRVFPVLAGLSKFGVTQNEDEPIAFIRNCLDKLNAPENDGDALFESLSTSAKLDLWTSYNFGFVDIPVYNYAIARVRYRGTVTVAEKVKCFFRMFNVAATGLNFNTNSAYRNSNNGDGTVPLLGRAGGEISSIPFFASERIATVTGEPGATSMATQPLSNDYEVLDIAPQASGQEVTKFFGCWLDINQVDKRFPSAPGNSDGPWPEASCRSIQELVRGEHMCLVAETFFEPDPTSVGDTPGTSDNLSQRNLAILHSDNPGGPDSHTVMHPFEVKPSEIGRANLAHFPNGESFKRFFPDELIFRWYNLPRDSEVSVYFSDIDTKEIAALAALRASPVAFEVINKHTLKFKVAGATWVPLPGGRTTNIPALLSIKLPDDVVYGNEYRVSIHQVSGRRRHIIGSCEFNIPISKAELIMEDTGRTLSVFKHIVSTIPNTDRWWPLMTRYVAHMARRFDALGGDSSVVHPNPDGSGRPYHPKDTSDPKDPWDPDDGDPNQDDKWPCHTHRQKGFVCDIEYDCHGRLSAFVLESCGRRRKFNKAIARFEQLLLRACRAGLELEVFSNNGRIVRISICCC